MSSLDQHPATPRHSRAEGASAASPSSFEMPENHLGVVVTPGSVDPERKASLRTTIIAVVSMPLFFLLAFTLCYVSATHAPVPHDMALTIAGPSAVTEGLADSIGDRAPGAFDITLTEDADAARQAVEDRDAVGALLVDGADVTTVTASGGGRLAVGVVVGAGQQVAQGLGGTATVDDVSPLPADDPGGSVLFFLLVICTVGAFLSITAIAQAIRRVSVRAMVATALVAAVLAPVIGFAMISVHVDYEVPFGTVAAVMGIGMVYALAVGLLATALTELLGGASIFAVILLLIALNFPSAGGSVPGSMLPPFWQVVHQGWIGSGAFEAMRSVLFFDGHQVGRWLLQLAAWLALSIVAVALVALRRRRRERAAAQASSDAPVSPDAPEASELERRDAHRTAVGSADATSAPTAVTVPASASA